MNKFLKDLEKELKKLKINDKDIKEILEDHEEMIEAAKKEGLNEEQIELKFGNPGKLAKDILSETKSTKVKKEYIFEDVDSCVEVDTSDYNLVKTFPVISGKMCADIALVSDELSFTTYEGESIQVYENGVKDIDDYTISFDKEEFILKRDRKIKVFSFSSKSGKFLVLVPNNVEIKGFAYKTVSGDAKLNAITTKTFKIKTTSGDIDATNIASEDIKISTVSGDIEMAKLKGQSFEVSLVSGDLEVKKAVVDGTMYFHSVSGDIDLLEVECQEAILKTVSGDLEGKEFYPNEVTLKSISGDIDIENSDSSREIIVKSSKSVSGEVNIK